MDNEGYAKVCDIIAKIAGQPGYRSLVQIVTICKNRNYEQLSEVYKKAYMEDDKILLVENEFYELALNYKIELGKIIKDITLERWNKLLEIWLMNSSNKGIIRTKNYMDGLLEKTSKHTELLEKNLLLELARRKK